MGKYQFNHDGYEYNIEADDDTSAIDKFHKAVEYNKKQPGEEYNKQQQETLDKGKAAVKESRDKGASTWETIKAGMPSVFKYGANVIDENVPGARTFKDIVSPSLVKGIPVARQYVPQTEKLTEFEKEHSWASTGLQVAGGTGATLPLAAGAAIRSGSGFIPQLAGQLSVNAPLNVADTVAKKGSETNKSDIANSMNNAVMESLLPASVSKVFGQSARTMHPDLPGGNYFQPFMSPGGHKFGSGAPMPPPWSATPWKMTKSEIPDSVISGMSPEQLRAMFTVGAGAVGSHLGGWPGMVAGLVAGGPAGHALEPLARVGERVIKHPSTQDILRALSSQGQVQKEHLEDKLGLSSQ